MARPRLTDEEKKARGTFRHDRTVVGGDEDLLYKLPTPPKHYEQYEREIYKELGRILIMKGVLTAVNLFVMKEMVAIKREMRECENDYQTNGRVLYSARKDGTEGSQTNPAVIRWDGLQKQYLQYMREFGLTPRSSATAERAKTPQQADPMADLLSGK